MLKFSTARSSGSQFGRPLIEHTPSFFSVASGYKLFASGSRNQPDPDQEGVVWNEPEQYYSTISRKERIRESRLGMLRQKSLSEPSSSGVSTPVVRGLSNSSAQAVFVKAKTDVISTIEAADSKLSETDTLAAVDDLPILQELSSVSPSRPSSVKSVKISATTSALPDSDLQNKNGRSESEKDPSVISVEGGASDETARQGQDVIPLTNPPVPRKEFVRKEFKGKEGDPLIGPKAPEPVPATSSSLATALANGITSAVRFVTHAESLLRTVSPPPPSAKHHHALLLADITSIDERPHIKYDWTIGKRLRFSCTVYYAKQFDALRRRFGISDLSLKSLMRCVNWTAEGGKSKSNFWKTSDERFIIKSLVNAWNVTDLYVLFPSSRLVPFFSARYLSRFL